MTGCDRIRLEARFVRYLHRLPNGCEIWTGAQSSGGFRAKRGSKTGGGPYGNFKVGKDSDGIEQGTSRAHVVFAFLRGKLPSPRVPDGFHLDHGCENGTLCVVCTELMPAKDNLALNWSRRKHPNAAAVSQMATSILRARVAQKKRAAAKKRRRRAAGNSKSAAV